MVAKETGTLIAVSQKS